MPKGLMLHEIEAAEIIAVRPHIMLFDDMGAGKTVSVLEGIKRASDGHTGPYKCIVCVPNTIIGQWVSEIMEWLSCKDFKCVVAVGDKDHRESKYEYFKSVRNNVILITNYLLLVKDDFFKEVNADALILDEGYLIRNKRTKAYQFLRGSVSRFDKVILLSGNIGSFTDSQFYDVAVLLFPSIKKGDKATVCREIGDSFIYRKMADIYGLKEPEFVLEGQVLTANQEKLMKEIAVEEAGLMKVSGYNARHFYNKRMSVLNSPRILDKIYSMSPKEEYLIDTLSGVFGKCVVYCQDRKFFKVIKSDLSTFDFEYVEVSGEMPIYVRERNINLFRLDPSVKILLLSGVGKFGLNLQEAQHLICMGVPKGKFELGQIIGRLNRINQKARITCYIPYHTGTEEEQLVKKLMEGQ